MEPSAISLLDQHFAASQPSTLGRNRDNAVLPVSFLDDLNTTSTRKDALDVYAAWVRRIVGADNSSISIEDGVGKLVLMSLSIQGGLPKGTKRVAVSGR